MQGPRSTAQGDQLDCECHARFLLTQAKTFMVHGLLIVLRNLCCIEKEYTSNTAQQQDIFTDNESEDLGM